MYAKNEGLGELRDMHMAALTEPEDNPQKDNLNYPSSLRE